MGSTMQGAVTDFIILLRGISVPSHCQHNNDSLELPVLISPTSYMMQTTETTKLMVTNEKTVATVHTRLQSGEVTANVKNSHSF